MKKTLLLAAILASAPVFAQQTAADHAAHHPAPAAAATAKSALSDAEVRKVDLDAKKITLRHGPIANLDMPPMTMVFQVKDPALLQGVKAGDKVRFSAEKIGSVYTVTGIETAK